MKIKILFINVLLLLFSSISFAQNMSWEELLKRTQRPLIEPIRDEATGLYGYQNTKTGKIICSIGLLLEMFKSWCELYKRGNQGRKC